MTSIVVAGVNHRTAPVELLERLAISDDALPKALHQLLGYEHVVEGAVLSTCNRVDVAAVVTRFHGGAQDLRDFLAEFGHVAPEDLADRLYTYHDEGALRHLFRVAAGVDSMIIGEPEVLGQVRRAFLVAEQEGAARRVLGHAFRRALAVGKRARTETAIARTPVSFSSAAVDLVRRALPEGALADARALVIGSGRMARLSLQALRSAGVGRVTVVSRTPPDPLDLGDAAARPWEDLEDALADADVILSSTASPSVVLERELVLHARAGAPRPLVIVDIAVPRDVDPAVGELDDVVLHDIDDLRSVVETNVGSRVAEVSKVDAFVAEEIERFVSWQRAGEYAPTIATLVQRADDIRRAELERSTKALAGLTPQQRDAVDHLTRRLISKLLHKPVKNARRLAASERADLLLEAVHELFELDDGNAP